MLNSLPPKKGEAEYGVPTTAVCSRGRRLRLNFHAPMQPRCQELPSYTNALDRLVIGARQMGHRFT